MYAAPMTKRSHAIPGWSLRLLALAVLASGGCSLEPNPSPATVSVADVSKSEDAMAAADTTAPDDVPMADVAAGDTLGGPDVESPDADDSSDTAPSAGACPVIDGDPCGGDILGTWTVAEFCPDDPEAAAALCENPFDDPACTDTERACPFVRSGTIVFSATEATLDTVTSITPMYRFSSACVQAVKPEAAGAEAACAAMGSPKLTCVYEPGTCVCTGSTEPEPAVETLPVTIDGQSLKLGESAATFCVSGDRLTLDFAMHPVSWRWWVLDRAPR